MMLTSSVWVAVQSSLLAASSSSEEDGGGFGLLFLASGFIFYAAIYIRYRNVDKRHKHESETQAAVLNMQQQDEFVKSRKGLSNRRMTGANNTEVRGARRKLF